MIYLVDETPAFGGGYVLQFEFTNLAELADLPTATKPYGPVNFACAFDYGIPAYNSTAICVETGETYVFDASGVWSLPGGGGPSGPYLKEAVVTGNTLDITKSTGVHVTYNGGVSDHNDLTGRNAANQHTTAAITGLDAALNLRQIANATLTSDTVTITKVGGGAPVTFKVGPNEYVKDASVDAAGTTLTLTKNDGTVVNFTAAGGVIDHNSLTGRNAADQHPTAAITGLDAALALRQIADASVNAAGDELTITKTDGSTVLFEAGPSAHEDLTGRSDPDQHPISAVTGLAEALQARPVAVVYNDVQDMYNQLNAESAAPSHDYIVGQSMLIKTLAVPDVWICKIESSHQTMTYTTDDQFIADLRNAGAAGLHAGWYRIVALESDGVSYAMLSEVDDRATHYYKTLTQVGERTVVGESWVWGAADLHDSTLDFDFVQGHLYTTKAVGALWSNYQFEEVYSASEGAVERIVINSTIEKDGITIPEFDATTFAQTITAFEANKVVIIELAQTPIVSVIVRAVRNVVLGKCVYISLQDADVEILDRGTGTLEYNVTHIFGAYEINSYSLITVDGKQVPQLTHDDVKEAAEAKKINREAYIHVLSWNAVYPVGGSMIDEGMATYDITVDFGSFIAQYESYLGNVSVSIIEIPDVEPVVINPATTMQLDDILQTTVPSLSREDVIAAAKAFCEDHVPVYVTVPGNPENHVIAVTSGKYAVVPGVATLACVNIDYMQRIQVAYQLVEPEGTTADVQVFWEQYRRYKYYDPTGTSVTPEGITIPNLHGETVEKIYNLMKDGIIIGINTENSNGETANVISVGAANNVYTVCAQAGSVLYTYSYNTVTGDPAANCPVTAVDMAAGGGGGSVVVVNPVTTKTLDDRRNTVIPVLDGTMFDTLFAADAQLGEIHWNDRAFSVISKFDYSGTKVINVAYNPELVLNYTKMSDGTMREAYGNPISGWYVRATGTSIVDGVRVPEITAADCQNVCASFLGGQMPAIIWYDATIAQSTTYVYVKEVRWVGDDYEIVVEISGNRVKYSCNPITALEITVEKPVIGHGILNIVALTQAEYDALPVKDPNTLYVVDTTTP